MIQRSNFYTSNNTDPWKVVRMRIFTWLRPLTWTKAETTNWLLDIPKLKAFSYLTKPPALRPGLFAAGKSSCLCLARTASPSCCQTAKTISASNLSISPFISFSVGQHFLFTHVVHLSRYKNLTESWPGPEPRKSFNRPIRTGADPSAAIRETWALTPTPCLWQPLLHFRRSTNWASSSSPQQPFCKWRVWERRESGNRHENNAHWVYGRDGVKEIEIKYPRWREGGF